MRAGTLKKGTFFTFCFLAVFVFMNVMTGCSVKDSEDTSAMSAESVSQSESESDTSAEATSTPEPTQEPLTTEPVATPEPTDVPEEQNTDDTEETRQPTEDETEETETDSEDQGGENQQDDSGETMEAVQAKVNVYEGEYRYEYVMTGLVVPEYYKVKVSNVTDTSFDFTIYYLNETEGAEEVVFRTHTAVFVGDGMEAVYDGVDYYLTFTFPDYHEAYPDATDMEISGYGPVEGMTFSNNSIPGHEFS